MELFTAIISLMKLEWLLIGTILLLLMFKLTNNSLSSKQMLLLVNLLIVGCLAISFILPNPIKSASLFNEMFVSGQLIVFEKQLLLSATFLVSLISYPWLVNKTIQIEFYIMLLTSLTGMFFMLSSGNLLMLYVALEMATIPLAVLVNFDLEKKKASEAAMKMIFNSAMSSGFLLMGISFIYGLTGSLQFSQLAVANFSTPLAWLAFILFFTGFAFKVSAVPFHFWTADVYEGAPVGVTAFLSVVSKAAATLTFMHIFYNVFTGLQHQWIFIVIVLSFLTLVVGNLFALKQQSFKRFMAFSSIAQVGFVLLAMSANNHLAQAAIVYFIAIYAVTNLAVFFVIALVDNISSNDAIEQFSGFYQHNKLLTWVLALALFSLAGIPPTAGFFSKFFLLFAGSATISLGWLLFALLNVVVSLYYYLQIVRKMFGEAKEPSVSIAVSLEQWQKLLAFIFLIGILLMGMVSNIYEFIHSITLVE
ncbi:MAG: NADH-quinone oxidoreductase subunit N [Chitinophagaceae bacterium]